MLKFSNVNFKYEKEFDLFIKDLSFNVDRGEFISIIGPSGCGKSTIFRLITRLENTNSGDIFINNDNINSLNEHVGYMPQSDLLIPWRTILENASLPLEISSRIQKKPKKKQKSI